MREKEPIIIDAEELKEQEKAEAKTKRGLGQGAIDQFRLMWRLIWDSKVPFYLKMIPVMAAIYIVSPVDFIPDAFLGLGQLDDLGVLLVGGQLFIQLSPQHIVAQHRSEIQGTIIEMVPDTDNEA